MTKGLNVNDHVPNPQVHSPSETTGVDDDFSPEPSPKKRVVAYGQGCENQKHECGGLEAGLDFGDG